MAVATAASEKTAIPASLMKTKPIIFNTKKANECHAAMKELQARGMPVAVDAEGVRLSAKGRMTLLQICSWDGQVYLIDLIDADSPEDWSFGKRLLENGGVKQLLEDGAIVKVMHSCSNDCAALWFQFNIRMKPSQIFDTQSADKALQSLEGTVFPRRKNLRHLGETYETPGHPLKDDHETWMSDDKEAWGKRPLSQELITYACCDVLTLIPELYTKLKGLLERGRGTARFHQYVDWDANSYIEQERVNDEKKADRATADGVRLLYSQIQRDHTRYTSIDDLTEDERAAVRLLQEHRDVWGRYSNPTVDALEERLQLEWIEKIQEEVDSNPVGHYIGGYNSHRLYTLGRHPNERIKRAANPLQRQIRQNKEKAGGGARGTGRKFQGKRNFRR